MATKNNAAQAGAAVSGESAPVNLHDLCAQSAAAGYDRDLLLRSHQIQDITRSLRGITACTAVLLAGANEEDLHLGDWLRAGLVEAVYSLAWNAHADISSIDERAKRQGGAA